MEKGTGFLDVTVDLLLECPLLQLLPRSYRLIGADVGLVGCCRFIFESEHIKGDNVRLIAKIEDAGAVRTITIEPI